MSTSTVKGSTYITNIETTNVNTISAVTPTTGTFNIEGNLNTDRITTDSTSGNSIETQGNKFVVDAATGNVSASGTLSANAINSSGSASINALVTNSSSGNSITTNNNKFIVAADTGNISSDGSASISTIATTSATGNCITTHNDKFTVAADTGNVHSSGSVSSETLSITGTIGNNVSGNINSSGSIICTDFGCTLAVIGATSGDAIKLNNSKFQVDASTGQIDTRGNVISQTLDSSGSSTSSVTITPSGTLTTTGDVTCNGTLTGNGNMEGTISINTNTKKVKMGFGTASGSSSMVMGEGATASGDHSIALVKSATASGNFSMAIGHAATAVGQSAVAIGTSAETTDVSSVAIGSSSKASATGVGIGAAAESTASSAIAVGFAAKATASSAVMIGTGTNSVANTCKINAEELSIATSANSIGTRLGISTGGNYSFLSGDNVFYIKRIGNGVSYTSFDHHRFYTNGSSGPQSGNIAMYIASSGNVGIRNTNPAVTLHVKEELRVGDGSVTRGIVSFQTSNSGQGIWAIQHEHHLQFRHNGVGRGRLLYYNNNTTMNFTGQHRCTASQDLHDHEDFIGLIVCANTNEYISIINPESGINAITINDSLPIVNLSVNAYDKTCFGVISEFESKDEIERGYVNGSFESVYDKEEGDNRIIINSIGEGSMWVSNANGNLESGDYITTSYIKGYGMKQDSEFLANYTVAKITMDCNFIREYEIQKVIKRNGVKNVLDSEDRMIWEDKVDNQGNHEYDYKYKTRFINETGAFICERTYFDMKNNGENVYIAAFVGCTYHCG